MVVCDGSSSTCASSNIDQFVPARTRSSSYNKFTNQSLKESMVKMDIDLFVNVKAMIELLLKLLSDRKHVDTHIADNIRIRAWREKLELYHLNIGIEPRHCDTTFLTAYKGTANNYT